MYGPIRPPTKAIGRIAPTTASVARMVDCRPRRRHRAQSRSRLVTAPCARGARCFPRRTIASSTRMADREDQREQRDAIERVAIQIEHEQRHASVTGIAIRRRPLPGVRARARSAPTRTTLPEHVPQQLVAFLRSGLAVIARQRQMDV
jgi:hypothetical protein